MRKYLFTLILTAVVFVFNTAYAGLIDPVLPDSSKSRVEILSLSEEPGIRDRLVRIEIRNIDYPFEIYQHVENNLEVGPGQTLGIQAIEYRTVGDGLLYANAGGKYLNNGREILFRSPASVDISDVFMFDVEYRLCDGAQGTPLNITNQGEVYDYIRFELEPGAGSGGASEYKRIQLYARTSRAGAAVEMETSDKNSDSITLANDGMAPTAYARLRIPSRGQGFAVYQTVEGAITDSQQNAIQALNYKLSSDTGTSMRRDFRVLEDTDYDEVELYRNTAAVQDTVVELQFAMDQNTQDLSGFYNGRIRYIVRWDDRYEEDVLLNVKINIKPVFDITVLDVSEDEAMDVVRLKEDEYTEKEYLIQINTNKGTPYSVVQHVDDYLVNESGEDIKGKNFMFYMEKDADQPGKLLFTAPEAVKKGDTVIYDSDIEGSGASINVKYALKTSMGTSRGYYMSNIRYSLMEK